MMKLYQTQHQFYCGIDLHANEMYACVVDQAGKKLLHRNFKTQQPEKLLDQLQKFHPGIVVGCESTFNWYWLCDQCTDRKIPFVLGHALFLKAIHGGKVKNDKIDSEKIALLLRGGNFALAYAYPRQLRATRDLLRRRTHFVRRRGETLAHIQIVNYQHNLPAFPKRLQYKSNRAGIAELFSDPAVRFSIQTDLAMLDHYDDCIRDLERFLEQSAKVHDAFNFHLLKTIPGIGRIIAMTILYEIENIRRFPEVGDFLSYARLVRGSHTSAGKSYGSPGKKMGNAYLKWAFSEAVPLLKRESPEAKTYAERIEKKHGKARAHSNLAVKLGRAVYFMLRRGRPFDLNKTLGQYAKQ
jgi:transposase